MSFMSLSRFAPANLDLMRSAVARDLRHCRIPAHVGLTKKVALTCLDQVGEEVRFVEDGQEVSACPGEFVDRCMKVIAADGGLISRGPTRSAVQLKRLHPRTRRFAA